MPRLRIRKQERRPMGCPASEAFLVCVSKVSRVVQQLSRLRESYRCNSETCWRFSRPYLSISTEPRCPTRSYGPSAQQRWKDIYYNSGLNRGGRVQFKQLLNLDGHSTEYGPLNWLIIAHTLTEIYDTEYYYHEMTNTCFVQCCGI